MSKSTARLSRLGVLAPAALSACMDASVLAAPAAGAIVSTLLNQLSKAFMLKKWFHGVMSAAEAEQLLLERGKSGSFLVRESRAHPGEFVLSVRVRARVSHVMIRRQHDKYDIGSGEQFDDLVGLIEHLRAYPLEAAEGAGGALRLLQPVSGVPRARRSLRKPLVMQDVEVSKEPEDKYGFDREFQSIKMLEERHEFTTIEGNKPENIIKNRYRNIVPYDQTRVVLRARGAGDYINASYVRAVRLSDSTSSVQSSNESLNSVHSLILTDERPKTPLVTKSLSDDALMEVKRNMKLDMINGNLCQNAVRNKFYIATQGCLSNTKDDFWQMIWQEDIRIIAMITKEVEKGKVKCERYWPATGLRERRGPLFVRAAAETCCEHFVLREFHVSDDAGCVRTIYQYQFTTWPDHGTPPEPDGVLTFMEEINRRMYRIMKGENPPEQNILCVHCSAGVGRTGTFIALDILIDKIKSSGVGAGGSVDVCGAVRQARAQRGGMVQNAAQYRFIHRAVRSYIATNQINLQRKILTEDA